MKHDLVLNWFASEGEYRVICRNCQETFIIIKEAECELGKQYCECKTPSLPIGGNGCEFCGKEVLLEWRTPLVSIQSPPPLGVSTSEKIGTKDTMR